jgi:hypothetical protein
MAMGARKHRQRQEPLWFRSELPSAPGRPFYNTKSWTRPVSTRFASNAARRSYHRTLGRPCLPAILEVFSRYIPRN